MWLIDKCIGIEILRKKHDDFNMHKKIREIVGTNNLRRTGTVMDTEGQVIINTIDKLDRWRQCMVKNYLKILLVLNA